MSDLMNQIATTCKQINEVRILTDQEQMQIRFHESMEQVREALVSLPRPMTNADREAMDNECRADLREMMMFYGSWEALRKVIKELEDNDKEAAWERHEVDKLK